MSWSKPAGLLALLLGLAACGFQPIYGRSGGTDIQADLTQVEVLPIADRVGQQLHNHLLDSLNPFGRPVNPSYRLRIKLTESRRELAVQKTELAVDVRGDSLDGAQRLDEAPVEPQVADGEVATRPLRLGAEQHVRRDLHLPHRVLLHTHVGGPLLAACGLSILLRGGDAEPPPESTTTLVALALAFSIITARRLATSPRLGPQARLWLHLASFLIALALGGLGILVAWSLDSSASGVLLPTGAFILCLRPPPPLIDLPRAR